MRSHGYLAFIVGLGLTLASCLLVRNAQEQQIRDSFQRDVDKIAYDTNIRLQTYFDVLLSIRGMYAVNDDITRAQFTRFVGQLNLAQRYPGFQAIQFVRQVPDAGLADFVAGVRRDRSVDPAGYPQFIAHPANLRQQHYIIEYTEPLAGNENAFGLDLAALPPHLRALELGRDSGKIVATERITLVQDASGAPGFVARAPVYRNGAPLETVAQRRAALDGFVAVVFRDNDLMREVIDSALLQQLYVRIHDAGYIKDGGAQPPSVDNLMYDSAGRIGLARLPALDGLSARVGLNVGQRYWVMDISGHAGARYSRGPWAVPVIAAAGLVISALLAALLLASQRRRALADQLHQAHDEQRALQDSAAVGIVLVAGGRIVRCNRGLEEMMGYPVGQLAGCRGTLLTDGGADGVDAFDCGSGAARFQSELELLRRDGTPIWCLLNGRLLDPAQPDKGCVWVVNDISERRRAEAALVEAKRGLERSLLEVAQQKTNAEDAHAELSAVLVTLRQAQANLITSEKMAALGALVAGIAHELNTPIGNCLLTATALGDMVGEFERTLAGGAIKRSALEQHLQNARQACTIMAGSLARAAGLITSFKQVAVDQASDQRRVFNLVEVLCDTLATHAAQLKRAGCEAALDLPERLEFDSYPGSVSQVLSNLISNAILHGFEGRGHGTISISARQSGDNSVQLVFRDNGAGMSERTLHQIFDPFFTTKMGQGGSGLGMNIVYNIVTSVLRGTITVESVPGTGTCVTLLLPMRMP